MLLHLKYCLVIIGLHMIAMLSLVGLHVFPNLVRGDLVGMDVFFAISGFLICLIILTDLDAGKFSFLESNVRRIWGMFPALGLVSFALNVLSSTHAFLGTACWGSVPQKCIRPD